MSKVMTAVLMMLVGLAATGSASAACTLPHNLTNGQPADATQVMGNMNSLATCIDNAPAGSANAIQYNAGSGALGGVGPLTDGQLVIGDTGSTPVAGSLAAGTGIAITNGPGTVTISATGATSGGLYDQVMSATPTAASTGFGSDLRGTSPAQTNVATGVFLSSTGVWVASCLPAPSPPYSFTALLANIPEKAQGQSALSWTDGTKFQLMRFDTSGRLFVQNWSALGVFVSNAAQSTQTIYREPTSFLKIRDDGTTISFLVSSDGVNFVSIYSVAKVSGYLSAYSTACFLGNGATTLLSWTQGTN